MKSYHLLVYAILMAPLPGAAATVDRLTWCETMVTGQGEVERARGLAVCLPEVLVKVSGDTRLATDHRVAALALRAGDFVASLEYEDRMGHLPLGDEQGTRDRPFFLRPTFAPAKIDALLADLGARPWGAERPVVAVMVTAHRDGQSWLVARGIRGVTRGAQVEALDAAGRRFGVPLVLPSVDRPGEPPAGDVLLTGDMTWDEAQLGWRTDWHMNGKNWSVEGVSFDDAFRAGIGGAARLLSGHGEAM